MLGQLHSEAAGKVRFYMATLEMESLLAALAYRDLRNQTRRRRALYRDWAWQRPPIDNDSSMALNPPFHHEFSTDGATAVSSLSWISSETAGSWRLRCPSRTWSSRAAFT